MVSTGLDKFLLNGWETKRVHKCDEIYDDTLKILLLQSKIPWFGGFADAKKCYISVPVNEWRHEALNLNRV